MKQINADIKSGNIRKCYLIYGEEAYMRQNLKQKLRKAIVGDDTMNYTYMEGRDANPDTIVDIGDTMPFFAEHRLILVENSGFFKKEADKLANYLPNMPESTCLVFVEEAIDKRNKLYNEVTSVGYAAECKRQGAPELKRWVARGLAQFGKKIQVSTLEEFLARTGDDMENIRQEMEKLIAYTGEREEVTVADLDAVTTSQISDRVFEMIDAIATRNQKKALDLYYDLLLLKEPPMKILVLIGRQFRSILQVKELRELGMSKDQIAEKCHTKPFIANRYMNQAARFSKAELEEYVRMCVETDEAVKSGNLKDTLAAEMMIVTFSRA